MTLYMDRHDLPGATAFDLAAAHMKDLDIQDRYGVHYVTYWFDPGSGGVFCLVDAPSKEAAETVHRESHGLVGHLMIEVDRQRVHDFLGNLVEHEPGEAYVETGFRTILFTDMVGSTSVTQRLGDVRAMHLLRSHDAIIRGALAVLEGREVKHTGDGIMASFGSVARAVECAVAIQRSLVDHNADAPEPIHVRIGVSAGEPVTENDDLFGSAVQLAARLCSTAETGGILVSGAVRELALGKGFVFEDRGTVELKGFDEPVRAFEVRWV
jgi:class 3 adenylate cyclase